MVAPMTITPIAPVVPSRLTLAATRRLRGRGETRRDRPLPLAVLASRPTPAVMYRVAAVDRWPARGAIGDARSGLVTCPAPRRSRAGRRLDRPCRPGRGV